MKYFPLTSIRVESIRLFVLLWCISLVAHQSVVNSSYEPLIGAKLDGSFTQGGLLIGTTVRESKVYLDGHPIRVSDEGIFLVGFGRDAKQTWSLSIVYPDLRTFDSTIEISARDYEIQRIDGLAPRKVTPLEEDLKRIRADVAQVKAARATDDARTDFLEPFDWPVLGIITGVYGSQRILNGEPRRPHYGIDIAAPRGTPVLAPASGKVTLVHPDMFYSGGTLIIDHGHGLSSTFLHLDSIKVAKGDYIKKNQVVATVGSTGRGTGPHLDWRINLFSQRLDPQLIVGEMPSVDSSQ